jgi:hypothetical protein
VALYSGVGEEPGPSEVWFEAEGSSWVVRSEGEGSGAEESGVKWYQAEGSQAGTPANRESRVRRRRDEELFMVPAEQREEEGLRTVGSEGSDTRPITKMSQHHFAGSLRAGIGPHNTILKRLF